MRKLLITLTLTAATLMPGMASAHGIWIAQRTDDLTIIYGHGAEDGAYDAKKVKSVVGVAADGTSREIELVPTEKNVSLVVPDDVVALTTVFDNGFWIKDSGGKWLNVGKKDLPGGSESSHTLKYNTHILGHLTSPLKPGGAMVEILPLVDPTGLAPGAELPIQLFFDGKPYAGARIINDYVNFPHDTAASKTDAEGKTTVKVTSAGLNVLAVEIYVNTPSDENADEAYYNATLSYVLPHVE